LLEPVRFRVRFARSWAWNEMADDVLTVVGAIVGLFWLVRA
jgi:hypothetical protein